ncbi:MAG: NAD-dependent epimerase/dehydratase family protein [Proteobacteria bacterium]|nr:NAD-dependent epimerase/dehydratase family protein [Pseudomonadota bacterium]
MPLHLITGGSGFVGSNIAWRLAARGEAVRVLDLWKAEDLTPTAEFVRADINDAESVMRAMRGVDYVHHNAAAVPLAKAGKNYWKVNVEGTANVLRAAAAAKVKMFSHMSSSAIFGSPGKMPITNATPLKPVEIYGRAKREADILVQKAHTEGTLPTCCIRPRTIIGPGRLGIFQILFDWIKHGAPVLLIGTGNHLFQFVHADDLADVSILACLQKKPGLYNVGTDRFGTLREDLGALIKSAGSKSRVQGLPTAPAIAALTVLDRLGLSPLSPWHYLTYHKPYYFDSAPVTQALGWKPKYGNQEMLIEAYQWFLAHEKEAGQEGGSFHKSIVPQGILKWLRDFAS